MAVRSRRPAPPRDALVVRDALPEDVPALARMGARLARDHHRMDPARFFPLPEPVEEGYTWWLGKERRSRKAVVLAALLGGRVVGYAYGRLEERDWSRLRDRSGVGVDLFVAPRARRHGVGRALVEALVARLAERGMPRVVIDVAARNPRALAAFQTMGFRPTMIELAREVPGTAALAAPRPPRRRPRR